MAGLVAAQRALPAGWGVEEANWQAGQVAAQPGPMVAQQGLAAQLDLSAQRALWAAQSGPAVLFAIAARAAAACSALYPDVAAAVASEGDWLDMAAARQVEGPSVSVAGLVPAPSVAAVAPAAAEEGPSAHPSAMAVEPYAVCTTDDCCASVAAATPEGASHEMPCSHVEVQAASPAEACHWNQHSCELVLRIGRLGRGHSDLVHAEVADAEAGLLAQGAVAPFG